MTDRSEEPDAYRRHLARKNREWLSRIRRKAEERLLKLGRPKDAWKVLRVRRFGALAWGEEKARAHLGGDIRDVWRQRKAAAAVDTKLENAWLAAETAALATHAQAPEVQRDPLELMTTLRLLEVRRLALADPAARAQWLREARQKGGKAPKLSKGIYTAILEVVRQNPDFNSRKVWEAIPLQDPERRPPILAAGFEVYRALVENGECVCQGNGPEPDNEIVFATFRRYVTKARKDLRSN